MIARDVNVKPGAGDRAMDLEARISYVNPAFCAMTGFAEHDLIGTPGLVKYLVNSLGENAQLEEMIGVIESMAGTRLASAPAPVRQST